MKSNVATIGIVALIGLGGYIWWRGQRDTDELSFRVSNIRFKGFEKLTMKPEIQMEAFNPRNQSLTADKFVGKILLNGSQIGDIQSSKIKIAATTNSQFWLPTRIYPMSILTLARTAMDLYKGGTAKVDIEGYLHIGGLQHKLTQSFVINKSMLMP